VRAASKGPWVIGVSNGYYGNLARVEYQAVMKAYAATQAVAPLIKKLMINNAGTSVAAQISAVDAMIAEHVNAIILDSNSLTGLNPAIAAATKAGIPVVATNDLVSSPLAYSVEVPWKQFAIDMATGFVKELGGKGNIVVLRGLSGNATDALEASGFNSVFAKHPTVKVLNVSYGQWDDAVAETDMSSLLSRYNDINGVYTEGGMAYGVVRAFLAAHRTLVPMTEADINGFACQVKQYHSQGLQATVVPTEITQYALALKVALDLLSGKKEPHSILTPLYTWNTAQVVSECNSKLPAEFCLWVSLPQDGINLTTSQVVKFM